MRRVAVVGLVVFGVVAGMASWVSAEPCAFGSCFTPTLDAIGSVVTYSGSGSVAEITDSCTAGDKYKLVLSNTSLGLKASVTFTSQQNPPNCVCDIDVGDVGTVRLKTVGFVADKAKVKKIAGPVSVADGPYLSLAGTWVQTSGGDDCGF